MKEKRIFMESIIEISKYINNNVIVIEFWKLFEKSFDNKIEIKEILIFLKSLFKFFKINYLNDKILLEFIYQELMLINLYINEKYSNFKGEVNIFLDSFLKSANNNLKYLNDEVTYKVQEIDFDQFTYFLSSIYLKFVINPNTSLFYYFWEFVYLNIIHIDNYQDNINSVSIFDDFSNTIRNEFKYFSVFEEYNHETDKIYENSNIVLKPKKFKNINEIIPIGSKFEILINNLLNNDFKDKNTLSNTIESFVKTESKFFVFYNLKVNNNYLVFNAFCFNGYLFELVKLKEKTNYQYYNLYNSEFYNDINYIDRQNTLYNKKVNPYRIELDKKFVFELEYSNISEHINQVYYYSAKNFDFKIINIRKTIKMSNMIETSKIEGIENSILNNKINNINCKHIENEEWEDFRLLNISEQKNYKILIIGKKYSKKSLISNLISKFLNIENINIDLMLSEIINKLIPEIMEYKELLQNYQNKIDEKIKEAEAIKENENGEATELNITEEIEAKPLEPKYFKDIDNFLNGKSLSNEFIRDNVITILNELDDQQKNFVFELSTNLFDLNIIETIFYESNSKPRFTKIINMSIDNENAIFRINRFKYYIQINKENTNGIESFYKYNKDINKLTQRIIRCKLFGLENLLSDEEKENYISLPDDLKEYIDNSENHQTLKVENICISQNKFKLDEELDYYNFLFIPLIKEYGIQNKIDIYNINSNQFELEYIIKDVLSQLRYQKPKLPIELEEASNFQSLVEADRNFPDGDIRRNWSFFNLFDSVDYKLKNRLIYGLPEFSVDFYNYIFVFSSDENKKKFISNPKDFINNVPNINSKINISISLPDNVQIKEFIKSLANNFNLTFLDVRQFFYELYNEYMESNKKINGRQFWENEEYFLNLGDFLSNIGNGLEISEFELLKLYLIKIGVEFDLKFDPEVEKKKLNDLLDPKSKKKVNAKKDKKPVTLAMLSPKFLNKQMEKNFYMEIKENSETSIEMMNILPDLNYPNYYMPDVKGFIFYNSITNIDSLSLIENCGILIDKYINLWNFDETENPLNEKMDVEKIIELISTFYNSVKEKVSPKQYSDILWCDDFDILKNKINNQINFFAKSISDDELLIKYDFEDENYTNQIFQYGLCGKLCPVYLIDNNWLNEIGPNQFSCQINNRNYFFSSEKDMEKFKSNFNYYLSKLSNFNISNFLKTNNKLFLTGGIGSGLSSLSLILSEIKNIEIIDLKKELIKRKKSYLLNYIEQKFYRDNFDLDSFIKFEEIIKNNDWEKICERNDMDSETELAVEMKMFKELIFSSNKIFLMDFYYNDLESTIFKNDLKKLFEEANLFVDHLIILESGEKTSIERLFNKTELTDKYNLINEEIKLRNNNKIEVQKKIEFENKLIEDPETKFENIEINEDDLNLEEFVVIEDELVKIQETIKNKRENQLEKINEFLEFSKLSKIYRLNTEYNFEKIIFKLKEICNERVNYTLNIIKKCKIRHLTKNKDNGDLVINTLISKLIETGQYQLSEFGTFNCLKPYEQLKNFEFNLIYKQKIYFVSNKDEFNYLLNNADVLDQLKQFTPTIENFLSVCFVNPIINKELKVVLENKLDTSIISIRNILNKLFTQDKPILNENNDENLNEEEITNIKNYNNLFTMINEKEMIFTEEYKSLEKINLNYYHDCIINKLKTGFELTDLEKTYLIYIEIKKNELDSKGFVLEDFPENSNQMQLLGKLGYLPKIFFSFDYSFIELKNYLTEYDSSFMKISKFETYIRNLMSDKDMLKLFINSNYQNLYILKSNKNYIINTHLILKLIENVQCAVNNSFKNYVEIKCFDLKYLPILKQKIKDNLSGAGLANLSKLEYQKELTILNLNYKHLSFNNNFFFGGMNTNYSKSKNCIKVKYDIPILFDYIQCYTWIDQNELIKDECHICRINKVHKDGLSVFSLKYNNNIYLFCSIEHILEFYKFPLIYSLKKYQTKRKENVYMPRVVNTEENFKILVEEISMMINQSCQLKLMHPEISIKNSALILVSLFLKMRNPFKDILQKQKYEKKLNLFIKNSAIYNTIFKKIRNQISIDHKDILETYESIKENISLINQIKNESTIIDFFNDNYY